VQSSGTTLVENDIAATVSVSGTPGTAMQVLVSRQGGAPQDITQRISGGTLAGIRQARDTDAAALQTKLDQLVFDVATAINTQHALGVGLDSTSGRNLFTVAAPPGTAASVAIDPALVGRPDRVAAALAPGSLPGGSDNAAALAALVSANITGGNTRTAAQGWADLMGDVAQRKAAAASDAQVRDAMKAQVKSMRDSVSGVSLDEEMVNLTKYQRAYEATAKLIRLVDELLGDLMRTLK
jgi:flagellar hook-associated protein 1 FlgK